MQAFVLFGAACVLVVTVAVGIVAHELTHAVVLHLFGVPYEVSWFPESNTASHFGAGVFTAWAAVTPQRIPPETPAWALRLSAIAPLALALPFAPVIWGVVPDPLESTSVILSAVTVAWLACALPSPQDFSVFWYADRALDEVDDASRKA